jgi:hypothetical protein
MSVEVRRVVRQAVSKADGIAAMKSLGEFAHDFFQTRMQNVVQIDSGGGQRIVLFFRHGEDQPVRDDRAFCLQRESFQMSLPGFCDAALAFRRSEAAREPCSFRQDSGGCAHRVNSSL